MKIEQIDGLWVIRNDDGIVLGKTFKSNAEAWRWLEMNERDPLWLKGKRRNREAIAPHIKVK